MKINQPQSTKADSAQMLAEISSILEQLNQTGHRPCADCSRPCPRCSSTSCNESCSSACPHAPSQISSQRDRYSIEPEVFPLVFTLSQMQICQPCWSCEGHLNPSQELQKIPQVWFYSSSMILIRLFGECLSQFEFKKLLNYTWQISATYTARECSDSAFTLKPDLNLVEKPQLELLQKDLKVIADNLKSTLKTQCESYLNFLHQDKNRQSMAME